MATIKKSLLRVFLGYFDVVLSYILLINLVSPLVSVAQLRHNWLMDVSPSDSKTVLKIMASMTET